MKKRHCYGVTSSCIGVLMLMSVPLTARQRKV